MASAAYLPKGVYFNGAPGLPQNPLLLYAGCQGAELFSQSLGEELKPILNVIQNFFSINKAKEGVGHVYTLWTSSGKKDGTPDDDLVLVIKRVFYAIVGGFTFLKIVTVKMGVGMKALRAHAPRVARVLNSKAFPQVFCIVSVVQEAMKIRDSWHSKDPKEQLKFWSKSFMLIAFSACQVSCSFSGMVPALALGRQAHTCLKVVAAFSGCVSIGTAPQNHDNNGDGNHLGGGGGCC